MRIEGGGGGYPLTISERLPLTVWPGLVGRNLNASSAHDFIVVTIKCLVAWWPADSP